MFTAFSLMLQQLFAACTKLASAMEKGASALDHLGGWTNDTAASFADQAREEREQKLAILKHNRKQKQIELDRTTGQVPLEEAAPVAAA